MEVQVLSTALFRKPAARIRANGLQRYAELGKRRISRLHDRVPTKYLTPWAWKADKRSWYIRLQLPTFECVCRLDHFHNGIHPFMHGPTLPVPFVSLLGGGKRYAVTCEFYRLWAGFTSNTDTTGR
jgi:hypothetical protein